ncbi:hypothetical protein [Congregibacter sp.]|uniref:hypothetical protein n=1 Tax=Congregibacter sp. TaxID=2744308 RepID=UPI003F6CFEB7
MVRSAAGDTLANLALFDGNCPAPFLAHFDARECQRLEDGWGPGMHRIDMELTIGPLWTPLKIGSAKNDADQFSGQEIALYFSYMHILFVYITRELSP